MILHDASSGTIAHGPLLSYVAPLPLWRHRDLLLWLTPSLQHFAPILVRRSPVATQRTYFIDVTQHLLPGPGTVHTSMVSYPFLGMDS